MNTFVYYDAAKSKISIATQEVSDAGDYIGELAEPLDPRSPYAKFVISSLMRNAGHNVMGVTIAAYTPPASEGPAT